MNNKISIVMPAYNSEKSIEKAIISVLEQTYPNFELIIVNNGSTDNTKLICEKFLNERIKYFEIEEANVSKARNYGIEKSEGDYLTFLDSDDEYYSSFLEEMVEPMKTENMDLVTCGFFEKNRNRFKVLDKDLADKLKYTDIKKEYLENLKENYLFNEVWNKIFKLNIIKNYHIQFDSDFELGEDFLFVLDYIKYARNFAYINKGLYNYNDNSNGLNLKFRENKFDIEYKLTEKLEKFYRENSYNLVYIYNRYGRIFYNGLLNIYSKNNPNTNKEKDKMLKKYLKENKNRLLELKGKVTDNKFKFFINYILLKGFFISKIFAKIIVKRKNI